MSVKNLLQEFLAKTAGLPAQEIEINTPEKNFGDYSTNVALIEGKKNKTNPLELAEFLAEKLRQEKRIKKVLAKVEAVRPGFINFYLAPEYLRELVVQINKRPESFGSSEVGKHQMVLIEYFQLNAAKPPHVGHLRSAVIGDSLKRIYISQGYKTVSDTHLGDWGTQFGILLWAYKNLNGRERVNDNPLIELNDLYVEANKKIEEDPDIREQAKQEFVKLEQGDKENKKLWEFFIDVTAKEIKRMVSELELLPFDYHYGESYYTDLMKDVLKKLEQKNLLKTGETGEQYVDLEECNLGRLICIKSDGGTTYSLRDLATLAYRFDSLAKKHNLSRNIYIVDNRQSHHLAQVVKTMEFLGYDPSKSVHADFGFMKLPEGAISTRKGAIIHLDELLKEARQRALTIINEKNPGLENKDKVAGMVGLGAIKYADLVHNRKGDVVFRWEEVLSFEGNTGPYLQYTHARLKSILRKGNFKFKKVEAEMGEKESLLARHLAHFPEIVLSSAEEFLPSNLANYLYNLATEINTFYHAVPVLQEENKDLRQARMNLVAAAAATLKNGLYLLGIEAPEQM